jgi:hypothetical protein
VEELAASLTCDIGVMTDPEHYEGIHHCGVFREAGSSHCREFRHTQVLSLLCGVTI